MPYKIEPGVLATVAKEVVGSSLAGTELIARTTEALAAAYPGLIDPAPTRWVGSKAGGILGKVRFLYFSPHEYVVLFGSPTGTQGFSPLQACRDPQVPHRRPNRLVRPGIRRLDGHDTASRRAHPHREGSCARPHDSSRLLAHRIRPGRGRDDVAVRNGGHAARLAGTRIRPPVDSRIRQACLQAFPPLAASRYAGANMVLNLFSDWRISPFNAAATTIPIGPNSAGPPRWPSNETVDPSADGVAVEGHRLGRLEVDDGPFDSVGHALHLDDRFDDGTLFQGFGQFAAPN